MCLTGDLSLGSLVVKATLAPSGEIWGRSPLVSFLRLLPSALAVQITPSRSKEILRGASAAKAERLLRTRAARTGGELRKLARIGWMMVVLCSTVTPNQYISW